MAPSLSLASGASRVGSGGIDQLIGCMARTCYADWLNPDKESILMARKEVLRGASGGGGQGGTPSAAASGLARTEGALEVDLVSTPRPDSSCYFPLPAD